MSGPFDLPCDYIAYRQQISDAAKAASGLELAISHAGGRVDRLSTAAERRLVLRSMKLRCPGQQAYVKLANCPGVSY